MGTRQMLAQAATALVGFAVGLQAGSALAASGEVSSPIQFQQTATCVNKAACTVRFNPVPAKRRFEIKYLNCRFDGPYQVFEANLANDASTPLRVDVPPVRSFYVPPNTTYTTFSTPLELYITAGRRAVVTVEMIGQGGNSHLRCLLAGNWVVLP